jgi:phage tail-like protein
MSELRPFALVQTGDQWVRGAFENVFLDYANGVIELAWTTNTLDNATTSPPIGAGLAFDNECRLYHSVTDAGTVQRIRRSTAALEARDAEPVNLFGTSAPETVGDFDFTTAPQSLREPRGLAVDENDRLFIAESGARQILVYDLWSERLLRRIALGSERPTCLAAFGAIVWAVLTPTGRVVKVSVGGGPEDVVLPAACTNVARIASAPDGTLALLCNATNAAADVWVIDQNGATRDHFAEPFATDVAWESNAVLVVARQPGADFIRLRVGQPVRENVGPLRARGYDGLGIVRTPDKVVDPSGHACHCGGACGCAGDSYRIGYWTARGFRLAIPARLAYERVGRATTYRLDSGAFQTQWGRVFLDACIPLGTNVTVRCIATDESDDDVTILRLPPGNIERVTIARPDLSPPMPPLALLPKVDVVDGLVSERASGRELPWTEPASNDPFRTYEGWLDAPAGRYLWITLELTGNTRLTPRVACIRAEHPAHDYLRRLPKLFSREESDASFLRRYLAMFEGFIGETEARGVDRNVLLSPRTAPDEVLPWLASFLGLTLDERWATAPRPGGRTADARREIIELAAWLFRFRGTVGGLKKFIELYVGVEIVLLEHFRLRARMSAMLGGTGASTASSTLGVGFRVGDAMNDASNATSGSTAAQDSHAHRFTVLIPATLNAEQLDVVRQILLVHRPAHTIFDVCTVGAGMRVGRGLHVGISSMVGATGGFSQLQLGDTPLGRGSILGRPSGTTTVEASRLGSTTRLR